MPYFISKGIETYISIKRVEKFLLADEIDYSYIIKNDLYSNEKDYSVKVENGYFYWEKEKNQLIEE